MGPTVFRARAGADPGDARALVICCSGSAWLPATEELVAHLALAPGSYDLLAVPGGAQFLLAGEYLPKFAWAGQRWLKFLAEEHELARIVVVAHQDCAWYAAEHAVPAFLHAALGIDAADRQRQDLARIAGVVRQLRPTAVVEAYFAAKAADGTVEFSREV